MNNLMLKAFELLRDVIVDTCSKGRIYYIANTGNWGDALIRSGAIRFFKHYNIPYFEIVDASEIGEINNEQCDKYLIYGGSGAWCNMWQHAPVIVSELAPYFKKVIVLPSTYQSFFHHLPNCIYFCRDQYESAVNMPQALFCHDMAFFLDFSPAGEGVGRGYFIRTDVETASVLELPEDNFDISRATNHFGDPALFFEKISTYREVYTDRLHVAIAGAISQRKVRLYSNVYFKNRAVFQSSIAPFFPKVEFVVL